MLLFYCLPPLYLSISYRFFISNDLLNKFSWLVSFQRFNNWYVHYYRYVQVRKKVVVIVYLWNEYWYALVFSLLTVLLFRYCAYFSFIGDFDYDRCCTLFGDFDEYKFTISLMKIIQLLDKEDREVDIACSLSFIELRWDLD